MKIIALIATIINLQVGMAQAQAPSETSPEKAAVIANDRAYEAAYAKADAKALADFFSENADYTNEDGEVFTGRKAIEDVLRAGLILNRNSKLVITADTVRVLSPETVLEKGSTVMTTKDGEATTSLYTAIHVKKDGKWKIDQLIESPIPAVSGRERLAELEWLVGQWEETDKNNDLTIASQYSWARGGSFLTRNVTVKRAGEVTLEGWQIIGWDPSEENFRTWTFDGEGGFAEGRFTRDGDRWMLREIGVAPDGSRTSADQTFTKLGPDRFAWEANNRTLNGDPQPSIGRIEINRVKGN